MNRYMFNKMTEIMAIIQWRGFITYHNRAGFQVKNPLEFPPQARAMQVLEKLGFNEVILNTIVI